MIDRMIVSLPIGKLKRLARQMLKGRYFKALIVTVIAYVIAQAPVYVLSFLFDSEALSYILNLYSVLITGPVALGLSYYFLELFRNAEGLGMESFTRGFSNFWNSAGLLCISAIFITLWSFLFIIPGIIAAINYSQAFYILADDPTLRPMECIARSKAMMRGNKGKYFLMLLSFLPWDILLAVPSFIYLMETVDISMAIDMEQQMLIISKAAEQPVYTMLSFLQVLIRPLIMICGACFYDIASGSLQLQFDGQVPYDYEGSSRDVYEITGFESSDEE